VGRSSNLKPPHDAPATNPNVFIVDKEVEGQREVPVMLAHLDALGS